MVDARTTAVSNYDPFSKHRADEMFDWDLFYSFWVKMARSFGAVADATMAYASPIPELALTVRYRRDYSIVPAVTFDLSEVAYRRFYRVEAMFSLLPEKALPMKTEEWCREIYDKAKMITSTSHIIPAGKVLFSERILPDFYKLFNKTEIHSPQEPLVSEG